MNRRVSVEIDDRQQNHDIDSLEMSELLSAVLADLSAAVVKNGEVGLAFVDQFEMTELNELHMGVDGPTDVLAFPIDGTDLRETDLRETELRDTGLNCTDLGGAELSGIDEGGGASDEPPFLFGDIVICPAVAHEATQPLTDELALLVVHGALHLVGHDHREPAETAVMENFEATLLDRYHRSGHAAEQR